MGDDGTAGEDGTAGDDHAVIDWRPVDGPRDAGLRPAQVLAARFDHTGEALVLERAAEVLADLERGMSPAERADATELGCLVHEASAL